MLGLAIVAIAEAAVFGGIILLILKHYSGVTKDLHLRLASKSLEEYHYWRDGHELEVEHNKQVLENVRKEKDETKTLTAEEMETLRKVREF